MGSLKRKNPTPPVSPALSKRPSKEECTVSVSANGDSRETASGRSPGQSSAAPPTHTSGHIQVLQTEESSRGPKLVGSHGNKIAPFLVTTDGSLTKDSRASLPRVSSVLEARRPDQEDNTKTPLEDMEWTKDGKEQGARSGSDEMMTSRDMMQLIPNHAGWFSWNKMHALEQRGLPEFYNLKSKVKTPTLYMQYRNLFMKKYIESPEKLFSLADLSTVISGNREAGRRIFEFLDHWGLINSRALVEENLGPSAKLCTQVSEEKKFSVLQGNLESGKLSSSLYHFDSPFASPTSKPCSLSAKAVPAAALAEAAMAELQVGSQGPAVEYHCNSCSADCSKRRFHCQKQADFDLCPDCYNDGKFSFGMANTDFILMEALTEANDTSSGGWTDQETLLLLEALELYGDNWSEIAEHVATKTKAQCILHFIRLPIEDPFLEAMELSSSTSNVQYVADSVGGTIKNPTPVGLSDDQVGTLKNPSSDMSRQKIPEDDTSVVAKVKNEELLGDGDVESEKSSVTNAITAAAQAAGLSVLEKPIAFSECGNPVMALVAFLAALVGPDIAATSAQTALKVLTEQSPAVQLAAKNSFNLETEDPRNDAARIPHDRAAEGAIQSESQSMTRSMTAPAGEGGDGSICADEVNKTTCEEASCTSGMGPSTDYMTKVKRSPSLQKIKNAAATALAAAAVKAKLLADQEEQEILQLAASVVDSQLKKLEIKLKLFRDLDMMLDRERDRVEKARQRLLAERAQIVATRAIHSVSSGQISCLNAAVSTALKGSSSMMGASSGFGLVAATATVPAVSGSGPNDSLKVVTISQFKDSHEANVMPVRPLSLAGTPQFATHSELQRVTAGFSNSK